MKLSLSILLVVAAALSVSAYKVPYDAQACTLGTEGKALGNDFKGYCCKTHKDCRDDCVDGKCTGAKGTINTTAAHGKKHKKTTPAKKHKITNSAKKHMKTTFDKKH